jgi:hypothetical protein
MSSAFGGGFVCSSILNGFLGDCKVLSSYIWLWRRSDIAAFCVNTALALNMLQFYTGCKVIKTVKICDSPSCRLEFFSPLSFSLAFSFFSFSCVSPRLQCTALFSYLLWTTLTLPETQPIGCSFGGSPIQPFGKIRSMWAMCQN